MLSRTGCSSKDQTDGLELTWGNAEAIVALTEKMGRREGFGEILADGIAAAWEKLGKIGTEYAVHVQGEEMPAHDPKFTPGSGDDLPGGGYPGAVTPRAGSC